MTKYYNHGLVGNSKMLAATDEKGKIQRIFWPYIDSRQLIEKYNLGLRISDIDKTFNVNLDFEFLLQEYIKNTNILKTELVNNDIKIKIELTDFIDINKDVLFRKIRIVNLSNKEREIEVLSHTSMPEVASQIASCKYDFDNDAGIHYIKDHYMAVSFDLGVDDYIIGKDLEHSFNTSKLEGFDTIGMMSELIISKDIGIIKAEDEKEITQVFLFSKSLKELTEQYKYINNERYEESKKKTKRYWLKYVEDKKTIDKEELKELWIRSILVFKLMQDERTGGIIASSEIDEFFTKSGRYAYCWGRDAVFITKAFSILGMENETYKFYEWAKNTQNEDGSWDQRYYVDGNLAPSWGFQIDETASIVHGVYECYKIFKNKDFLFKMLPMIIKANNFLVNDIEKETKLPNISFDLWEERRGVHAYSTAGVYSALTKGFEILKILNQDQKKYKYWQKTANVLKESTDKYFWKEKYKRYIRSIRVKKNPFGRENSQDVIWLETDKRGHKQDFTKEDWKFDISLLGLSVPFNMIDADDEKMKSTFKFIEHTLKDEKTGCFLRYEDDFYINGNPWVLTTLWAGMYANEIGDKKKAERYLYDSIASKTHNNFLPEQIDRDTKKAKWVVPLTWSHAMFIDLANKLYNK